MAKPEARKIGVVVDPPKQKCNDMNCPFHGGLSMRGRLFTGLVVSTKMRKTAVVEFERLYYLKKYERYEKRRTRLKVHNPDCIHANDGDVVRVMECKPLSKTKTFVVIQKLGVEKGFREKMEARETAKFVSRKEEDKVEIGNHDKEGK